MNWNQMLRNWVGFFVGTPVRAAITIVVVAFLLNPEGVMRLLIEILNAVLPFAVCIGILYLGLGIMLQAIGIYLPPFEKS